MPSGTEIANAYVSLTISGQDVTPGVKKALTGLDAQADATGKKMGARMSAGMKSKLKFGAGLFAGLVGAGSVALLKDSIRSAGDLEQSVGAIDSVYKDSAVQMHKWSKGAAQAVGLTRNEFNELGSLIGAQLKNGGTAMDQLAPKANSLIGLGADLSSMFGGTTKDAVEALSSALKGERDPIERYGVSLNQAKIDSEAASLGFKKVNGQLTDQAKQAATLSLIMKQTSDAHGNFAKESDTLAGKQQRLSANWADMKAELGSKLLPVVSDFVGLLNDKGIPALEKSAKFVKDNAKEIGAFAGAVGVGLAVSKGYLLVTTLMAAAQARQAIAAGTATAAQLALNTAMKANLIGLAVTAILALAAGLVIAYKKSETFRSIVNGAMRLVANAIAGVVDAVAGLLDLWGRMLRSMGKVPGFGWAKKAGDAMAGAAQKARDLADGIRNIPPSKTVSINVKATMPKVLTKAGMQDWQVFGGARAMGGPVRAGSAYIVGENGPEVFTAKQNGHITPNHELAGAASSRPIVVDVHSQIGEVDFETYVTAIVDDRMSG